MKALIWISCFFIASILNAILGYLTGWKVGYLLFYIGVYYVAKKTYKKWAEYKGIEAVPETAQVCARWHCEKCNFLNFSYGCLSCNVKHKFNLILSDPFSHPRDLRKNLSISDPYCQECRKKAIWTYGRWSFRWTIIACAIVAFISVIGILDTSAEIGFWVALASSVVIAILTLIIDSKINTRIYNLPKQYVPDIQIAPPKDQSNHSDTIIQPQSDT